MTRPQVFVSRPAVLSCTQTATYERVVHRLTSLEIAPLYLERREYRRVPWEQLRDAIGRVDGAVVLGFRQMVVNDGWWRTGTTEVRSAAGEYPTAWNHLEAGLAVMAEVPVLVLPEAGVADGVFSGDVWGGDVYGVRAACLEDGVDLANLTFRNWVRAVRRRVEVGANAVVKPIHRYRAQ